MFSNPAFAADQSALALAVLPGVSSTLDGKSEQVSVKMRIPVKASVRSDSTGKAQFMFPDDSTVSLAPETQIELVDFVDTPEEENVVMNMSKGVARFITGELSKRNPAAFTVQTPQAIIGVRGTVITVEVSGDVTRVYLTETSGKGVTVRNRNTGETIRLRSPGTLITVGPKGMEDRKASAEEAKMFAQLLRGKYRAIAARKRPATPALAADRLKLAAQGNLPFTNAIDAAQMDEYNRTALLKNATLVAQAGGSSASRPTPVVPVVPVVPPAPNRPSTPGNTPATPDVPDVPAFPDTPTTPDTPVVGPDVPSVTPPVENYMITLADIAGSYSADVTMNWAAYTDNPFTTSGSVAFTVPQNYISINSDTADAMEMNIAISNLNIPALNKGVPSQTNLASVDSIFHTNKAGPVSTISITTPSDDCIVAGFIDGELTKNISSGLNQVLIRDTDSNGNPVIVSAFHTSNTMPGVEGGMPHVPLTKH